MTSDHARAGRPALSDRRKAQAVVRIVDDDESILKALTVFLSFDDWRVRTYAGAAAFLASDDFETPGCIILDVRMPGMSGLELFEELLRRGIELPVVFLSAHGDIEMAVEAVRRGAKTFLVKPPKPEKLLEVLESVTADDWERRRKEAYAASLAEEWKKLTPAEAQVAVMVGKGLSNAFIAEAVGGNQSNVSHQLRILKDARIVRSRRAGKNILYSVADEHVTAIVLMSRAHAECR